MIRAHQPGSEPIDIPETIPNPVVVPKPTPTPTEPACRYFRLSASVQMPNHLVRSEMTR